MKDISISGVLVGFVVVVATTIVLSIFSPFLFSSLVETGDLDILLKSTGPLAYALVVIFVATMFGVYAGNKVANSVKLINGVLIIVLYAAFSYMLSVSPSNKIKPYPLWYVVTSYVVLLPGAIAGHWLSTKLIKQV